MFCIFLQKTFVVQDCNYWNDGSRVSDLEIGSNVSCTSNGDYITIMTNTSGEKDVKLPVTLTGDWEFETTIAESGTTQDLTWKVGTGQQWGGITIQNQNVLVHLGNSSQTYYKTVAVGMTLKITYVNGVMSVYWNNEQLQSRSVSVTGKIGYYTNSGRVQKIKNLKLKAL